MDIVIIDDSKFKANDSIAALSKIYENAKFECLSCLNDALVYLYNKHSEIDLIILDWCFPEYKDSFMPEPDQGIHVLEFMKRKKINIRTIICSSDEVTLNDNYPNVIGSILYSPTISCYSRYLEILNIGKHTAHVDAPNENDVVNVNDTAAWLEERLYNNPWLEEDEKQKEEQKQKSKWKRKRSSEAWWNK